MEMPEPIPFPRHQRLADPPSLDDLDPVARRIVLALLAQTPRRAQPEQAANVSALESIQQAA